jgi:hypothetical protein
MPVSYACDGSTYTDHRPPTEKKRKTNNPSVLKNGFETIIRISKRQPWQVVALLNLFLINDDLP